MGNLRIGYSAWGYLGDYKFDRRGRLASTPDGNAAYSWALIRQLQKQGHTVFWMQEDRDWQGWRLLGKDLFKSFCQDQRVEAYRWMQQTHGTTYPPDLDILLVEWRWPIPGRNCVAIGEEILTGQQTLQFDRDCQPDLLRQRHLLEYYGSKKTKIVLWDLDHKLTADDEHEWRIDAILETSLRPKKQVYDRISVKPPFILSEILSLETPLYSRDFMDVAGYIGSRYERDEIIDKWIGPLSEKYRRKVAFWGKWEPREEVKARWPDIRFHGRIEMRDFGRVYGGCLTVPLLAKQSYLDTGFLTPRPIEALLFGSLPIALGVEGMSPIVAEDPEDLIAWVDEFSKWPGNLYQAKRKQCVEFYEDWDASYFVRTLENLR